MLRHESRLTLFRMAVVSGFISVAVLLGHGLFYTASDLISQSERDGLAWVWLITYHILLNVPLILAALLIRHKWNEPVRLETNDTDIATIVQSRFIWLLLISLIGLALHWDAKLKLLDGAFNGCWASLRGAWLHEPRHISLVDRLESMAGHLLSSAAYLGVLLGSNVLISQRFQWKNLLFFIAFSVVGISYSMAIVSRSVMLVLLIIVILGGLLPYLKGVLALGALVKRSFLVIGLFTVVTFSLAIGIFGNTVNCIAASSSSVGAVGSEGEAASPSLETTSKMQLTEAYEDGFFKEVPVRRKNNPNEFEEFTRNHCRLCNMVFLYLNHGIYNFAEILSTDERGPSLLLRFAIHWGQRLHLLTDESGDKGMRVFGRGGATLPGAAFHDYGATGVVLLALLHGVFALCAAVLLRRSGFAELWGLTVYAVFGISSLISGLFVAPSLVGFPFVIFSILAWGGLFLFVDRYQQSSKPNPNE